MYSRKRSGSPVRLDVAISTVCRGGSRGKNSLLAKNFLQVHNGTPLARHNNIPELAAGLESGSRWMFSAMFLPNAPLDF